MRDAEPKAIHLKDYRPPNYLVDSVYLVFDLHETHTLVDATLRVRANPAAGSGLPLELNHNGPELLEMAIDGEAVDAGRCRSEGELMRIDGCPAQFTLTVRTRIHPEQNTALEGLYKSSGNYCTQCEAEGFRRITYFPDRPDVLAVYTTTIRAERADYPVLLANGNLIEEGELPDGRHYATWHDPFPKPSYLFAMVAGDLVRVADTYTTGSGREVALHLYVQYGNEDKCGHALRSLQKAMAWDEQRYGREYDLDIYMIVAVDDFNMGAMENKGLNIFNSRFVLARPDTATDVDFVGIEGVIAHEYFHNWSGNRVTCRDWFQLSLKEGFTVFRDQQFTADMTSPAVKRIDDVGLLRTRQFAEDAGPMAHPIRPDAYIEINNFYTLTVYEKGAEVVRMLHTLLGEEGFRRGTDLYFQRHDGQAVTTDDFIQALEEANGRDLSLFRRWYSQAGTPQLHVRGDYNAAARRYTLTLSQQTPPTPGQSEKQPLHIPVATALFGRDGKVLAAEQVLELTEAEQRFVFENVPEAPIPSLLRGFSAPVKLEMPTSPGDLAVLMAHDTDPFNRWEAGQRLAIDLLLARLRGEPKAAQLAAAYTTAYGDLLAAEGLDDSLRAEALVLPSEDYLGEFVEHIDPEAIHLTRQASEVDLVRVHHEAIQAAYQARHTAVPYSLDAAAMGRRRLANTLLGLLARAGAGQWEELAWAQYQGADNMTDAMAALQALVHNGSGHAEAALADFYDRWHRDSLVLDKWFALQASSPAWETVERVAGLTRHPDFNLRNPNRARSVLASFGMRNTRAFHRPDGAGYALLADFVIELDTLNPQVAARMVGPLTTWRRYIEALGEQMRGQLKRIAAEPKLSRDLYEVVAKSLAES